LLRLLQSKFYAKIFPNAPLVWQYTSDQVKYKIGTYIEGYRTNLHDDKLIRGIEFLTIVGGRMNESLPARVITLANLADQLESIHEARDNFIMSLR
jgi:hypothetical protein